MFARKITNARGRELQQEWIQQVQGVLDEAYDDLRQKEKRYIKAYGYIYEDEILLVICFRKGSEFEGSPISFFISVDYQRSQKDEKLLKGLLDFSGKLIDDTLQRLNSVTDVYSAHWEEHEYNKQKYYFKVSRENVELSLKADLILKER